MWIASTTSSTSMFFCIQLIRSAPLNTEGIFDMKAFTVLTHTPPFSDCIRSTIASIWNVLQIETNSIFSWKLSHLLVNQNVRSGLFGGVCRGCCAIPGFLLGSNAVRGLLLLLRGRCGDGDHLLFRFIVTQLVTLLIFWPFAIQTETCEWKGKQVKQKQRERGRRSHEMNISILSLSFLTQWVSVKA